MTRLARHNPHRNPEDSARRDPPDAFEMIETRNTIVKNLPSKMARRNQHQRGKMPLAGINLARRMEEIQLVPMPMHGETDSTLLVSLSMGKDGKCEGYRCHFVISTTPFIKPNYFMGGGYEPSNLAGGIMGYHCKGWVIPGVLDIIIADCLTSSLCFILMMLPCISGDRNPI
jgi:hypothetical protein